MLKMSQVETIKELQAKGIGPVAIAERPKITRKTVSKYMVAMRFRRNHRRKKKNFYPSWIHSKLLFKNAGRGPEASLQAAAHRTANP